MSLPVIAAPEDFVTLVSQKQPVKYRAYLVGEERLLLMAQQSNSPQEIERAVRQIIERCTFGALDVATLPSFDVELLFLQLRAKSLSNVIDVRFRCKNETDGKMCDTPVPITIDIADIKLTTPPGHSRKVMLSDSIGVMMKYPTAAVAVTDPVAVIAACLDSVFTATGDVFEAAQESPDEVLRFVETLTLPQIGLIRETFFDTMPTLQYAFTFVCPKCGWTEAVVLKGLMDFFD